MKKIKMTIGISGILVLLVILVIIMGLGLTGFSISENKDIIEIGVITSLSGELATYGQGTLNAALLAQEEINANGGNIQIMAEDSPCDANSALGAFNKLSSIDGVDVILGPLCSNELLAIAPIANKNEMIIISSSATSPEVTNAGDYIFRSVASDDIRAKVFAGYLIENEIKEIAIIYENDDAGVGFEKSFVREFESLGGEVSISEIYEKGTSDMRTQLTKIEQYNPENVLMVSFPAETGRILVQSKELGLSVNFFEGFEVMSDPQVSEIAGDLVEGVVYIQSISQKGAKSNDFAKKYLERYGEEAPYYAVEAYDIVYLYSETFHEGSSLKTKEALYNVQDYNGASGVISFDENGDVLKPFEIGKVINKKLVAL